MSVRSFALPLLVVAAFSLGSPAARAAPASPTALVGDLSAQLRFVLADGSLSEGQRQLRYRGLLDEGFDFPTISRFVLGRFWQGTSDAFHRQFTDLFESYVVKSLSSQLAQYSEETMNTTGTRAEGEHTTVVSTVIVYADGAPPTKVDWQVEDTQDGLKIVDVNVSGVSMVLLYRDEFAAVIDRNAGQVSALISELRDKLANPPSDIASVTGGAVRAER